MSINIGSGVGHPAKIVVGIDSRSGERVNLLCTHCSTNNHSIASAKKVNKGPASGSSNVHAANMAEEDMVFSAGWQPPTLGETGYFFGGFGGFNVEVFELSHVPSPSANVLPSQATSIPTESSVVSAETTLGDELIRAVSTSEPSTESVFEGVVDSGASYNNHTHQMGLM